MNDQTDQQLLRIYAETRSEAAFAELVRRQVDLVYSAALRMVGDAHQAQDITQATFVALAQNAAQLTTHPVLSGWLHRTAQNLAGKTVRTDVRRRQREQEAATMNELLSAAPDASWKQIAPHLDAALGELSEPDRDAVLLRYFEKKSAAEIGHLLDISPEAAQKRVSRVLDRLREFFAKRGISVGAGGLAVVISTNAVQTAPSGLALTISTAATLMAATLATTATVTTTKVIAMTTFSKVIIGATLTVAIGTGLYQAQRNTALHTEIAALKQQHASQLEQLKRDQKEAAAKLTTLEEERNQTRMELSKLRGESTRARATGQSAPQSRANQTAAASERSPIDSELPKDSWNDAGFSTPQNALKTRGWAIVNGNRERFKESLLVTDGARKMLEDMLVKMAEASKDPNKAEHLQAILDNKLGVEDAFLMPLMALNEQKGFTGYRIVSEQSPTTDETVIEIETDMASMPAQKEALKFRRIDGNWRLVIDEQFVKSQR